jgi:putative ABC transport system ATP-binding protein
MTEYLLEVTGVTHRPGGSQPAWARAGRRAGRSASAGGRVGGRAGRRASAPRAAAILHDVSMRVADGELVALAGRSGSGKSTLCHLIAGLDRPTEGSVAVAGRPADSVRDWTVVSLLPQRLALTPELTVGQNASLPALLRGLPAADGLLGLLGLAHLAGRLVTETSLGEQQRTAIARTLALRPRLAVLDEPTGHQDDDHVERVVAALREVNNQGRAILVATHDERVLDAAHRVVHLDGGRVIG